MNKLEKILAQSVTPEMVAEQLTEKEIEEVIEEYEEKAKHAEESIERANKKEKGFLEVVERYQRSADDWKEVAEQEKGKSELYRSVVEKAKQALAKCTKNNEIKSTPNKQCENLIKEAQEFWRERLKIYNDELCHIKILVDEDKKTISALNVGGLTGRVHSSSVAKCHPDDEWNEDIGKAIAVGRLMGEDVERFTGITHKEESPNNSFVYTTPDGKVLRVVKRRAKVGEWVVIIDDSTLGAFKVGDIQVVKGHSDSQEFEVIGCRESGFYEYYYIDHVRDYYVVIAAELPF